ncbi:unnamed protein product, partial [Gadus morhua 'NCC']
GLRSSICADAIHKETEGPRPRGAAPVSYRAVGRWRSGLPWMGRYGLMSTKNVFGSAIQLHVQKTTCNILRLLMLCIAKCRLQ